MSTGLHPYPCHTQRQECCRDSYIARTHVASSYQHCSTVTSLNPHLFLLIFPISQHTSFLWDLDVENISKYLTLPNKRPEYRQSRSHRDFLVEMRPFFDPTASPGSFEADVDVDVDPDSLHLTGGCSYTHEYTQHLTDNTPKPDPLAHFNRLQQAYMVNKWVNTQAGVKQNSQLLEESLVEHLDNLFKVQEIGIDDVKDVIQISQEHSLGTKLL